MGTANSVLTRMETTTDWALDNGVTVLGLGRYYQLVGRPLTSRRRWDYYIYDIAHAKTGCPLTAWLYPINIFCGQDFEIYKGTMPLSELIKCSYDNTERSFLFEVNVTKYLNGIGLAPRFIQAGVYDATSPRKVYPTMTQTFQMGVLITERVRETSMIHPLTSLDYQRALREQVAKLKGMGLRFSLDGEAEMHLEDIESFQVVLRNPSVSEEQTRVLFHEWKSLHPFTSRGRIIWRKWAPETREQNNAVFEALVLASTGMQQP